MWCMQTWQFTYYGGSIDLVKIPADVCLLETVLCRVFSIWYETSHRIGVDELNRVFKNVKISFEFGSACALFKCDMYDFIIRDRRGI